MSRNRWLGSLGWRFFAAFLAVAVSAVALVALVAAVSVDRRSGELADAQREQLRADIAVALAAAYTAGRGSWSTTDLAALGALAANEGLQIVVVDQDERAVAEVGAGTEVTPGAPSTTTSSVTPPGPGPVRTPHPGSTSGAAKYTQSAQQPATHQPAPSGRESGSASRQMQQGHGGAAPLYAVGPLGAVRSAGESPAASSTLPESSNPSGELTTIPIVVDGLQVGAARLSFPTATPSPVADARESILRQVGLGAGLAVLLAAIAAAFMSRRLSRPLVALAGATRAFAAGDPHPEQLIRRAPGEIGDVGRAFASMADTVRQQDELRRAVIADVAHELRTPVTILRGQTEQLLDGIVDATPEQLVSLHDEVLRLGRLTDDLSALSSADAAGLALRPEPVDLAALADQTGKAMQAQFDDAGLTLSTEAPAPVIVQADAQRLAQVLTNLLTNAAKFTPSGGRVSVTVRRDGANAVLTVADTGPGIAPDERTHVFERFWRGRAAGSRSGSGVGLAVVATLVDAHGGTVSVSGAPDGGAVFTVRLPSAGE